MRTRFFEIWVIDKDGVRETAVVSSKSGRQVRALKEVKAKGYRVFSKRGIDFALCTGSGINEVTDKLKK
jgi:hypothetical protein